MVKVSVQASQIGTRSFAAWGLSMTLLATTGWAVAAPARQPRGTAGASMSTVQSARTVWEGVYTPEQAERGQHIYSRACGHCHSPDLGGDVADEPIPALRGGNFLARWDGQSLYELFRTTSETMPRDARGSLSPEAYRDVIAFLLKKNLMPAADMELPLNRERLEEIRITTKPLY